MWHPHTTRLCDEMHYGPNKQNMKRNHFIYISEEYHQLLMVLPPISDASNQLRIVSRWLHLILCCSGAISRYVVLIIDLRRVRNRGGLLSSLQPNPSDQAEPPPTMTTQVMVGSILLVSQDCSLHVYVHKQPKVGFHSVFSYTLGINNNNNKYLNSFTFSTWHKSCVFVFFF